MSDTQVEAKDFMSDQEIEEMEQDKARDRSESNRGESSREDMLDPEKPYLYRTADGGDEHRSWTAQSEFGSPPPIPGKGDFPSTRFHPDELPDPEVVRAAGLPQVHPGQHLIDENHRTESPMGVAPYNPSPDHPDSQITAQAEIDRALADDIQTVQIGGQAEAQRVPTEEEQRQVAVEETQRVQGGTTQPQEENQTNTVVESPAGGPEPTAAGPEGQPQQDATVNQEPLDTGAEVNPSESAPEQEAVPNQQVQTNDPL